MALIAVIGMASAQNTQSAGRQVRTTCCLDTNTKFACNKPAGTTCTLGAGQSQGMRNGNGQRNGKGCAAGKGLRDGSGCNKGGRGANFSDANKNGVCDRKEATPAKK